MDKRAVIQGAVVRPDQNGKVVVQFNAAVQVVDGEEVFAQPARTAQAETPAVLEAATQLLEAIRAEHAAETQLETITFVQARKRPELRGAE